MKIWEEVKRNGRVKWESLMGVPEEDKENRKR